MRRIFTIFLAVILAFSIFLAGCNSKEQPSNNDADPKSTTKADSDNKDEIVKDKPADPFGKYEPPIVVTIARLANVAADFPEGSSYEDNVWTRSLEKDLGIIVKTEWEAVGDDKYETKLNLAIASDQLPDLMTLVDYSQFDRLVKADKIADLSESYENYASPQVKEYLTEDGGLTLSWATIKGKLMGLPQRGINYQTTRMIYIRQDWFDQSGLAKPETMDDVIEIARAFKHQDPEKRHGLAFMKKVLGDGFCDMQGIANAFGAYPRAWIEDSSGKLVYGTIQPEMKEAIALYADLYEEGLIDPEFAVKDGGKVAEQLTSSQIGVIIGNFWLPNWPLKNLYKSDDVDWYIYPLLPMSTNNNKLMAQTDTPKGQMHVVRKGYKNPEVMMKIMNYESMKINDPEKAEPEKFHSDKEGKYSFHMWAPLKPVYGPIMTNYNSNPNVTNAIDKNDTSYLKNTHDNMQYEKVKKYFDTLNAGEKPGAGDWARYKFFYGPDSTFGIQNYYFDKDMYFTSKLVGFETREMTRKKSTLEALEETMIVEIITGSKPLDYFDEFVEKWRALGGELIEFEVNEWWKSKK